MKMHWRSGGIAPLDGDEWVASCSSHLLPGKESPVSTGWEAGWAPRLVWTQWQKERNPTISPAWN